MFQKPKHPLRLSLECAKCGKTGKYDVGAATVRDLPGEGRPAEEVIGFTAYFRCSKCGSGGPWKFPTMTTMKLAAEAMLNAKGKGGGAFFQGSTQLSDGTPTCSPANAEDILRDRLKARPDDAYLWSRLGNLLANNDQDDAALPAYARAIELNPADFESHYRTGIILGARKQREEAALHLRAAARHAVDRSAPDRTWRRKVLFAAHKALWEMALDAREHGDKFNPFERTEQEKAADDSDGKPVTLELRSTTIRCEDDLNRFCEENALLSLPRLPDEPPEESAEESQEEDPEDDAEDSALYDGDEVDDVDDSDDWHADYPDGDPGPAQTLRREVRVGRNDPCSCGSGKKYKKCCMKA